MNNTIYFAVLEKLADDFVVEIGQSSVLSAAEILVVWGRAGIVKRLEKLAESLAQRGRIGEAGQVNNFIAGINNGTIDAVVFENWIKTAGLNDRNFKILSWLWDYFSQPILPLRLTLKTGVTKAGLLEKYGFAGVPDDITLQDIASLIVGQADTRNQPRTLRYIVGNELQAGVLYDFFSESLAKGVPHSAIYAGANGIYCPSFTEYQREKMVWAGRTGRIYYAPAEATLPPVNNAAVRADAHELTLQSLSEIEVPLEHRTAEELIRALEERAAELEARVSGAELEILRKYLDYLKDVIRTAYAPENAGRNTFYHTLVAISNFLVAVSEDIEAKTKEDGRLNVYLARDGINFWLAGYLRARKSGDVRTFLGNNIIFHLSRSHLEYIYEVMRLINDHTDEVIRNNPGADYWEVYMRNFRSRLEKDEEFRAIAEHTFSRMPEAMRGAVGVRIVESFAEGILTGFVKAVLVYYGHKDASAVEEFITAPKGELNPKRGVVRFEFEEMGLEAHYQRMVYP